MILAVAVGAVVLFATPRERSYLIDAQTNSLTVTISGTATGTWKFDKAILCFRLPKPQRGREAQTKTAQDLKDRCDPQVFEATSYDKGVEFVWPEGTDLRIRRTDLSWDADFEINVAPRAQASDESHGEDRDEDQDETRTPTVTTVEYDEARPQLRPRIRTRDFPAGSLVILSNADWIRTGTLVFSGKVTLGSVPQNNSQDTLLSGRYEIRELSALGSFLDFPFAQRSETISVKQGTFFKGDQIRLIATDSDDKDRRDAVVSGYIVAAGPEKAGLDTLIYATEGNPVLEISRFGAVGPQDTPGAPSAIEPSWTDRAINDPFLLALSALLALLIASSEIAWAFWSWYGSRRNPEDGNSRN